VISTDLVERAQRGDHRAFEVLAAQAIDRLFGVARRVLRDQAAAEDAVQDCLIRAWRDLRALRDPERWDAWLYRLLLNACRDEQRRMRRRPIQVAIDAVSPIDAGPDGLAEIDQRDELARGFAQLSVEHRMALTLHHYLGLGPAAVARVLGIPEGTAASRLHYGARALRAAIELDAVAAAPQPGGTAR
jgi:RNA polymerase sigma-70 factor (ECF subfamily)